MSFGIQGSPYPHERKHSFYFPFHIGNELQNMARPLQGRLHVFIAKLRHESGICRPLQLCMQDVAELGIATNIQLGKDTSKMPCSFKTIHIEVKVCYTMILPRALSLDVIKYN